MAPGLIIAAPASGSGKTVVTLGLLRHLARSGRAVASAKAGPDYIDPGFHRAATGRPCVNLDPWAMRPHTLSALARDLAQDADVVICEGVMGLFDGAFVRDGEADGSTADLAARIGWPVVLIVDAGAQAASAAAVVKGFADFRAGVTLAGVVFNRVAGPRHDTILRRACATGVPGVPVLGCLPRMLGLSLPERHLGLVQAGEHPDLDAFIDAAAQLIAENLDTDAIIASAQPTVRTTGRDDEGDWTPPLPPLGRRIAVARDQAFAFSYPSVLDGWRREGAQVIEFSPLADEAPPDDTDAIYLPGGYPELHAGILAGAETFLGSLRRAADRGAVVFGECGGYMVLGRELIDGDGVGHHMAGLLPLTTSFAEPGLHLGYRRVMLSADGPFGIAGTAFRGHEFHYAKTVEEGTGDALFTASDAEGNTLGPVGRRAGAVAGSFVHLIDRE